MRNGIHGCHLPLITEILRLEPLNFCQLDLVEKKGDGHQSSGVAWTPGTPPSETGLVLCAMILHLP